MWLVLGHCWGIGGGAPCGAKTGLYGAREGHGTLVGHTLGIVRCKPDAVVPTQGGGRPIVPIHMLRTSVGRKTFTRAVEG